VEKELSGHALVVEALKGKTVIVAPIDSGTIYKGTVVAVSGSGVLADLTEYKQVESRWSASVRRVFFPWAGMSEIEVVQP
jgi:hypothetical protein